VRALPALLFLSLVFAGCVQDDLTPVTTPEPAPAFAADVPTAVDWWMRFVEPGKRDAYLPDTPITFNQASREVIADTLRMAGFDVEVRAYPLGGFGQEAPDAVPANAYAVVATKMGTDLAGHRIGLGAHYDTQQATIQGAYDNGSGTTAVVHTCIALAKLELRRTLTCVLFDAEEEGAVASSAYVDDIADEDPFDLVLGFDMVGINWPAHEWKLYEFVGADYADSLYPFARTVAHEVLGYPEEGVEVFDFNDRNSDEASFAGAGIPTVRFAGGRTASDYPQYHKPDDTVDFVLGYVGGRDAWEAGLGTVMEAAGNLVLAFDATDGLAPS